MTTERCFPTATAEQLRAAAGACRIAGHAADGDWDAAGAEDARDLTEALGWSWDFEGWGHAAGILEYEAELAEAETVLGNLDGLYLCSNGIGHPASPVVLPGDVLAHPEVSARVAELEGASERRRHANRVTTLAVKTLGYRRVLGTQWPRGATLSACYEGGRVRRYQVDVVCNGINDSCATYRTRREADAAFVGLGPEVE